MCIQLDDCDYYWVGFCQYFNDDCEEYPWCNGVFEERPLGYVLDGVGEPPD